MRSEYKNRILWNLEKLVINTDIIYNEYIIDTSFTSININHQINFKVLPKLRIFYCDNTFKDQKSYTTFETRK